MVFIVAIFNEVRHSLEKRRLPDLLKERDFTQLSVLRDFDPLCLRVSHDAVARDRSSPLCVDHLDLPVLYRRAIDGNKSLPILFEKFDRSRVVTARTGFVGLEASLFLRHQAVWITRSCKGMWHTGWLEKEPFVLAYDLHSSLRERRNSIGSLLLAEKTAFDPSTCRCSFL